MWNCLLDTRPSSPLSPLSRLPRKSCGLRKVSWPLKTFAYAFLNRVLCVYPSTKIMFSIITDASGLGVGGVLQVRHSDKWEAAAFYSRKLQGAKQRYSATELEALALVSTINHFAYYLYGRSFQAFTDHKPLVQLTTSDRLNARLRRMAFKLQHWLVHIEYLPGQDNTLADALSREERPRKKTFESQEIPDLCLAPGDVEAQPPHEREGVGVVTPTESA